MSLLPITDLLAHVSSELDRQAADVRALHALVDTERADPPREAQLIDLVSQHLDELASVLRRLSASVPAALPVAPEILAPITLSALRQRLEGAAPDASQSNEGDVDFF